MLENVNRKRHGSSLVRKPDNHNGNMGWLVDHGNRVILLFPCMDRLVNSRPC